MEKFKFSYPTKVYFGEGSAKEALTAELGKYGGSVLLAYGGGSIKRNGVYDENCGILKEAGKRIVEFSGIMSNPTYAKVQEGAALARREGIDFILAVGGGSVIDCCKVISAQAVLDEDIWELEYVEGKLPPAGIPLGAVVTASGTGAEMNGGAVITHEEKHWKDAFWNTENVTVHDSFISGEYLGWNAKNLTLINCTIESLQGLCYIGNLTMKNCRLLNTTLAFEYSTVDAQIDGGIDSVINPAGGTIRADAVGELILEPDRIVPDKTCIVCKGRITCIAPTKAFNLAGLQTAAVVVLDPVLRHKVWRGLNTDEAAEPNIFAAIVPQAAFGRGEAWLDALREYLWENRRTAERFLAEHIPAVTAVRAEATYLLWLDCRAAADDADRLCAWLRESSGLVLSSGNAYHADGAFLRMNLACPREVLLDGLERLRRSMARIGQSRRNALR